LNGLGIATAIGANCIFRRKALDSIGGHAVHLAEDALTSMRMHAAGWRSVYLPYRGTSGLVPADLGSFFKQQFKWATGMFYLLFREYPRLFRRFDPAARPHYFFAGTFYFNGLATFLTLVLPIWFLFFKVFAVEFPLDEFLGHLAPYAASTVLTYTLIQRWYTHSSERRVPWRSLVLEKGTWHVYLMGLVSGLLNRRVEYLPTPKSSVRAATPRLVLPHVVVILLSAAAIAFALATYPRLDDGTLLMIFFAALNIALLLPVTLIALVPRLNWRSPLGAA
jgi:cellulose synthase (UDP-forming)